VNPPGPIETRPPEIPGLSDLVLVGLGGMGAVYRAMDLETGALRAVKILRRQAGAAGPTRRFRREFNAVSKLRHPGIVAVYRYGVCEDGEYIVMEWVPGGDMWAVVGRQSRREAEHRPLPKAWVAPALSVAAQVCEALSYLHAHRILHRDLKPENILVDYGGRARVVDFGIAKPMALEQVAPLTAVGETVGTARYMSPEQARSLDLDGRSDLYSLGVILFEVLSGRPPFTAPSLFDLLMAHVTEPAPRLADLVPQLPRSLCDLVNRLLAKDPSSRPPDAGALREEILDHVSPTGTLQASSRERVNPRDLNQVVVSALEASGRAAEVREEHGGDPDESNLAKSQAHASPDPTREGIFVDLGAKRALRQVDDPNALITRPDGHDPEPDAITPHAGVDEGLGAATTAMFPEYDEVQNIDAGPELFAPAFRGRDEFLKNALEGFQLDDIRPAIHWFRGESGSGRTRLLAELRDVLRFEVGAVVLTGKGQDPAAGMSGMRLIMEPVSWYLQRLPPLDLRRALGASATAAIDLCPTFREPLLSVGPLDPPPDDPASRRILYYQAIERIIALLAMQAPVALLVDDAELLDPDSLDLLRYLATPPADRAPHRGRPRLVALAGTETPAAWAGEGITILPLMGVDIAVAIQTALGWAVPPTRLARRAVVEGVNLTPRALLDWVQGLLAEAGRRSGRDTKESDLLAAASMDPRERWKSRLNGLSTISLEAAGVLGMIHRPVVLDWLMEISKWPEDPFIDAINALVRRGIAEEKAAQGSWGLQLKDRVVGEVAWEMLEETQRQAVGKRFADVMLEDHPDHPAAHDERPALAARGYLRAGLAETALPLLATAVRHEQAAGRTATGLTVADLWVDTARQAKPEDLPAALKERVSLASSACEWSRAEEDLDELEQLAEGDAAALLRVYTQRATLYKHNQNHEGVIEVVEQAFMTALEVEAPMETLFQLSDLMAHVDMRSGSLIAARDRWAGIAGEARRIVNPYWEMLGRANAATADCQLGEYDAAEHGFRKAYELAEDQCDQLTSLLLERDIAQLIGFRGDLDRARSECLEMVERAEQLGAIRVLGPAMTTLGEITRRLGLLDDAEAHLARGERVLRATQQRLTLALCLSERALVAMSRGDLQAAEAHAAGAGMAMSLASGVRLERERVHYALGKVAEVRGDRAAIAAARTATSEILDEQATLLGPEYLGRWVSVPPRYDVVNWAGWSPETTRS